MVIEIPVKFIYSSQDQRIYYVEFDRDIIVNNLENLQNMMNGYPCDSYSSFNFSCEKTGENQITIKGNYNPKYKDVIYEDEDDFLYLCEKSCEDIKQTIYKIKDNLLKAKFSNCKLCFEFTQEKTKVKSDTDFGIEEEFIVKELLNALFNTVFKDDLRKHYPFLSININRDESSHIIFYKGFYSMYSTILYLEYNCIASDESIDSLISTIQNGVSIYLMDQIYRVTDWYEEDRLLYSSMTRIKKERLN